MKTLFSFIILSISFQFNCIAQEIHSPAEILQILEKSSISYELHALEEEIIPQDRSTNLNFNNQYREIKDDLILSVEYKESKEVTNYLLKGEEYFKAEKFDLAREMYLKVLEEDEKYFKVMTFIGQTFGIEGNFEKSIEWYKKTISKNYIDYMAHWFLADAYKSNGELDKALNEITIAMILNRNNPRIKKSFDEIYKLKKLKTPEWFFTPQMRISSSEKNKVKLEFGEDWLGYALVKAVWLYEPGYKESMGVKDGSFSTNEELEAFVSLMTTFNKKKLKKNPEFKALQKAVDNKMVDEFIFYEIVLLEHPNVAIQLSEEFVMRISEYVINVRGQKK